MDQNLPGIKKYLKVTSVAKKTKSMSLPQNQVFSSPPFTENRVTNSTV